MESLAPLYMYPPPFAPTTTKQKEVRRAAAGEEALGGVGMYGDEIEKGVVMGSRLSADAAAAGAW